eukprot:m.9158 g.9158  ORF g.9158 m.9158 type:complete len:71 (-) comp4015_c0_seq1:135-347(-)
MYMGLLGNCQDMIGSTTRRLQWIRTHPSCSLKDFLHTGFALYQTQMQSSVQPFITPDFLLNRDNNKNNSC